MSEHNHKIKKRKFGKFKLAFYLISNNLLLVKHIMSKMDFIASAKQEGDYMEYVCQSELFNFVGPKDDIPEYIIVVDQRNLVVTAEILEKEK